MAPVAHVIVEIALNREFDYEIPDSLRDAVQLGSLVEVPFGTRHTRGYVIGLAGESAHDKLKEITRVVGDRPLIAPEILELARWISRYYMAPIEHAVRTVLPSPVRKPGARFKERLHVVPEDKAQQALHVDKLRASHARRAKILDLILAEGEIFLSELTTRAKTTAGTVRKLEEEGFVRIASRAELRNPLADQNVLPTEPLELMPQQAGALKAIRASMDTLEPAVILLYGVTGSGKTEIYLQAIQTALDRGQGAIVLVPEIALTPQTVRRFSARFGDRIAVLHSSLSTGERHDEWHRVRDGDARIVIGARSALFAPVQDLGLIIVDEEHETSYKQEESPRYNARDVAVMRGHQQRVAVVLGTATPSLESMHNAQRGKYGLATLPHRVDHRRMPAVRIVDMRSEAAHGGGRIPIFAKDLVMAMHDRLDRREQIMLFLNRRGFSTSITCPICGHVIDCSECSVSMTYHKRHDLLHCHICGARRGVPAVCPNPECRDPAFKYAGVGTQRVEEVVRKLCPRAAVARMDADTTTRKGSHEEILNEFRRGKIDILVGTQMIAKGLHFPNVTLVGVVNADVSLHMPDFRAGERTFQLLTQVAGRAGRGDVMGEVFVQTFTPSNPSIQAARQQNYDLFYDQEIEFRRELKYPPFSRLVCITLTGPSEPLVELTAKELVRQLQSRLSEEIICSDPAPAPLAKARGNYRYQVMLRGPTAAAVTSPVRRAVEAFTWPRDVKHTVDVDALSLM